jgi:hypothetical protein
VRRRTGKLLISTRKNTGRRFEYRWFGRRSLINVTIELNPGGSLWRTHHQTILTHPSTISRVRNFRNQPGQLFVSRDQRRIRLSYGRAAGGCRDVRTDSSDKRFESHSRRFREIAHSARRQTLSAATGVVKTATILCGTRQGPDVLGKFFDLFGLADQREGEHVGLVSFVRLLFQFLS